MSEIIKGIPIQAAQQAGVYGAPVQCGSAPYTTVTYGLTLPAPIVAVPSMPPHLVVPEAQTMLAWSDAEAKQWCDRCDTAERMVSCWTGHKAFDAEAKRLGIAGASRRKDLPVDLQEKAAAIIKSFDEGVDLYNSGRYSEAFVIQLRARKDLEAWKKLKDAADEQKKGPAAPSAHVPAGATAPKGPAAPAATTPIQDILLKQREAEIEELKKQLANPSGLKEKAKDLEKENAELKAKVSALEVQKELQKQIIQEQEKLIGETEALRAQLGAVLKRAKAYEQTLYEADPLDRASRPSAIGTLLNSSKLLVTSDPPGARGEREELFDASKIGEKFPNREILSRAPNESVELVAIDKEGKAKKVIITAPGKIYAPDGFHGSLMISLPALEGTAKAPRPSPIRIDCTINREDKDNQIPEDELPKPPPPKL